MPVFTIFFGVALMAVGIGTYAASDEQSVSMLLPAVMGLIALGLGAAALIKKDLRMHLMHGAVLLAALGVLVPLIFLINYLLDMPWDTRMNLIRVLLTVAFSGGYVYAAVQSFRAARRARKDVTPPPPPKPEKPAPATDAP